MNKQEEKKLKTHKLIIEVFWKLYEARDLHTITVNDIISICNINRSTFYRHFQDIYAILEEIESYLMDKTKRLYPVNISSDKDMTNYLYEIYLLYQEDSVYLRLLVKERKDSKFSNLYRNMLKDKMPAIFYQPAQAQYNTLTNSVLEMLYISLVDALIYWADDKTMTFYDLGQIIRGFYLNGIYPTLRDLYHIKPVYQTETKDFFS